MVSPPTSHPSRVRFAGILVLLVGASNVVQGIAAVAREEYFAVTPDGLLLWDYDGWAAIWFVLGGIQVLAGLGILAGKQWARLVGILVLFLAAFAQIVFLAAFPLWSVLMIGIAITGLNALVAPSDAFDPAGRQARR